MLEKLRQQLEKDQEELRAILSAAEKETRAFNEDETTRLDELKESIRSAKEAIERYEEARALSGEAKTVTDRLSQSAEEVEKPDVDETRGVTVGKDREASKPFGSFGEQLRAIAMAAHKDTPTVDKRLLHIQEEYRAATGHNELVPSDGGYLVQTDFAQGLYTYMHETGNILSRVRRIPLSPNSNGVTLNAVNETSRASGSRWGGVRGYWMEEAGQLTASQPHFRQIELKTKKLAVLAYATQEVLDDAAVLGSVIREAATEEIVFLVENSILSGTGAGQPLGILNSSAVVTVAKETSQAADTIVSDNLFNMYASMPSRNRRNGTWLIGNNCLPEILNLQDQQGRYLFQPDGGINQVGDGLLLGRPVIITEHNATIGDLNDILFLDLNEYPYIDKGGIRAEASIHVRFLFDEQAFRFIYRCDGQPMWASAVTQFNGTETLSPYVNLAARA